MPGSAAADLRAENGVAVACHCYLSWIDGRVGVCTLNRVVGVREFLCVRYTGFQWSQVVRLLVGVVLGECLVSVLVFWFLLFWRLFPSWCGGMFGVIVVKLLSC